MESIDRGVAAANALTARWAASLDDEAAAVLSGPGAYVLLALVAPFAAGPAREELHTAAPEPLRMPDSAATRTAIGVWSRADLPLTEAWRGTVPTEQQGRLSGDPAADQPALDAWAAERTGGLIPRLPLALTEDTRLVLASALSVRTAWAHPFTDGRLAGQGPWAGRVLAGLHRIERGAAATDPLRSTGTLTLYTVRGEQDVDVVLVLGVDGAPAAEVLPAAIGALAGGTNPATGDGPGVTVHEYEAFDPEPELHLDTVRFQVSASHDLLAHAGVFGLAAASDERRGHFPGISPEPLFVSQARQDAVAEFSAEGFEAAAVTAFGVLAGAAMPTQRYRKRVVSVSFDRPFAFLAVHRPTGLVLVAGWVTDPEAYDETGV